MKQSTWIVLLLFIIALGVYYLVNYFPKKEGTTDKTITVDTTYLLRENEATLTGIHIQDKADHMITLERNSEATWEIVFPPAGMADQSKLSAIETQLGALAIVNNLGLVSSPDDFGLTSPAALIRLKYSNGVSHTLFIGNLSPTNSGYYVQLDDGEVSIISQYSVESILELASSPPLSATPTQTPTIEEFIITPTYILGTLTVTAEPTP